MVGYMVRSMMRFIVGRVFVLGRIARRMCQSAILSWVPAEV